MILDKQRVILYGLGPIGAKVTRAALQRPNIEIAAAIDTDPSLVGRDLGYAIGLDRMTSIAVSYDAESTLRSTDADVVLHATESYLTEVYPELSLCLAARKSVISCAEEMVNPWASHPDIARRLDERAREAGVAILGIRANPGFVVGSLSLLLANACQEIRAIKISRSIDISMYTSAELLRLGMGSTVDEFRLRAAKGISGQAGLNDAISLVAEALGWQLNEIVEVIEPLPARERYHARDFTIEKKRVGGVRQTVRGVIAGRDAITVDLHMALGLRDTRDTITVEGIPPINMTLTGGLRDQEATVGLMINAVPLIMHVKRGLLTLKDVPLVRGRRPISRLIEEILSDDYR